MEAVAILIPNVSRASSGILKEGPLSPVCESVPSRSKRLAMATAKRSARGFGRNLRDFGHLFLRVPFNSEWYPPRDPCLRDPELAASLAPLQRQSDPECTWPATVGAGDVDLRCVSARAWQEWRNVSRRCAWRYLTIRL